MNLRALAEIADALICSFDEYQLVRDEYTWLYESICVCPCVDETNLTKFLLAVRATPPRETVREKEGRLVKNEKQRQ